MPYKNAIKEVHVLLTTHRHLFPNGEFTAVKLLTDLGHEANNWANLAIDEIYQYWAEAKVNAGFTPNEAHAKAHRIAAARLGHIVNEVLKEKFKGQYAETGKVAEGRFGSRCKYQWKQGEQTMGKRVIVNRERKPVSSALLTDPETWPYRDKAGERLSISVTEIVSNSGKYRDSVCQILSEMQRRSKSGESIVDCYSSYLADDYREDDFREFITRCSFSCGSILFPIGEKTDWKVWLTAPIVRKGKDNVPGDEFFEVWSKHHSQEENEREDEYYKRFCAWVKHHGNMISDMLRHNAIVFVP